jgi:hypothetical protein
MLRKLVMIFTLNLLEDIDMKNECGKTRPQDNPYEIWISRDGKWEWKVLKKYQAPDKEAANEYARWFCAVKSPFTYGSYELGDVYVIEIKAVAYKTY